MLPLVVGLVLGGANSDRLTKKLGTPKLMTFALIGLAVALGKCLLWTPSTPVWAIAVTLVALAFAMSNVMAPATESVMSSIPENKAGVGSAMNDVNRQVGGALGVAIIGSVMNSVYSSRVTSTAASLPAHVGDAVRDSIGSAHAVAQHLPATVAQQLNHATAQAFTDALGVGFLAAGVACAIAAPIVLRFLPDRRGGSGHPHGQAVAEAAAAA
jgi:MFS family permease